MQKQQHIPTITDTISLPFITEIAIAPGGKCVAYVVRTADWTTDEYVRTCFVHDIDQNDTRKISENAWCPRWLDDMTLAVLRRDTEGSARVGEKPQIWIFRDAGVSGMPITCSPSGVEEFWCYGNGVIYRTDTSPSVEYEGQDSSYIRVSHESRTAQLFYASLSDEETSVDMLSDDSPNTLKLTEELDPSLQISDLWASKNTLYLNCQFQQNFDKVQVWRLFASPAELKRIAVSEENRESMPPWERLNLPAMATVLDIAPDEKTLLLNWDGGRSKFFSNEPWSLWTCSPSSEASVSDLCCLTPHFERQILTAQWNAQGIYLHYIDGTVPYIARLDLLGQLDVLDLEDVYPLHTPPFKCFDISNTGVLAFVAAGPNAIPELAVVHKTDCSSGWSFTMHHQKITTFGALCKDWSWGTRETIHWTSRDNTKIEGVLFKPTDFDPARKYPLIVIVHGGPATASLQLQLDWEDRWFYPTLQFLARGILVLKPNYRGSDGRGHTFLELNHKNIGTGELWDIESGIDHLVAQGYVDVDRVGCAGWSYGGFVAAFATTHSNYFTAVSVGGAITNWTTYHAMSEFHRFAEKVFGSTPQAIPEIYRQASPVTASVNRETPTLIQHGDTDAVVPFANAQELHRVLEAQGIAVEFFRYPSMGHGVPNVAPRAAQAVMSQNLKWFCHHLLGQALVWDHQDGLE
ncbi:S9 family peptidase [Candidatus Poribacteria bacterium]|nr:S9 family peptidase [Candidatus Poribacteria bacterium]MYB00445.1 S9 family peptidase [Candidatus Poribacteria bacterium]